MTLPPNGGAGGLDARKADPFLRKLSITDGPRRKKQSDCQKRGRASNEIFSRAAPIDRIIF